MYHYLQRQLQDIISSEEMWRAINRLKTCLLYTSDAADE